MIASLGQFVKKHAQVVIWIVVGIVALGALVASEYHGRFSLGEVYLVHCPVFECLQQYWRNGEGLGGLSQARGETEGKNLGIILAVSVQGLES